VLDAAQANKVSRNVTHQPIRLAALGRQRRENPVERAQPAPADEAVVDRLVGTVVFRRIASPQTVADHQDDPADHPPVVHSRHAVRQRKIRRDPPICASGNQIRSLMAAPAHATIESTDPRIRWQFNGS
jgi:hypothetical protein